MSQVKQPKCRSSMMILHHFSPHKLHNYQSSMTDMQALTRSVERCATLASMFD